MNSITFFLFFIPILGLILLSINLIFAPHNAYQEKSSTFECGFHSFLGQNRTQFSISFFVFALLFLVFDLELVMALPGLISMSTIMEYGISIMIVFFSILTIGFAFELGKKALNIDSRQYSGTKQAAIYKKSLNIDIIYIFSMKMLRFISSIIYILTPWSLLSIVFYLFKINRDEILLLLYDGFYIDNIPIIGTIMPSLHFSSLFIIFIMVVVSIIIYNYNTCKLIFYFILWTIKIHLYKNWLEYFKFISLSVVTVLLVIFYPYVSKILAYIVLCGVYCYMFYLNYGTYISYYKYHIILSLYLLISLIGIIIDFSTNTSSTSYIDYSNVFFTDALLVNNIISFNTEEFYTWLRFPSERNWISFLNRMNTYNNEDDGGGPRRPNFYLALPGENEDQRKRRVNAWLRARSALYDRTPQPIQVVSAWELMRREDDRPNFTARINNQCSINELLLDLGIVPIRVQDYAVWEELGENYSLRGYRTDLNKYLRADTVNYRLGAANGFIGVTRAHPDSHISHEHSPITSLIITPTTLSHILRGMNTNSPPIS